MHERHSSFSPCSRTCQMRVEPTVGFPLPSKSERMAAGVLTASSELLLSKDELLYTEARPACVAGALLSALAVVETTARPSAAVPARKRRIILVMTFSVLL